MTSEWCLMPDNINKPVSYLIPMSERSSLAVSSSLEDSNIRRMAGVGVNVRKRLLNSNTPDIFDIISSAGMSLWFLTFAVLICVILFSKPGRSR